MDEYMEGEKKHWAKLTVFKFIDLYRLNPCLWDPRHVHYRNRTNLRQAWTRIQRKMGMDLTIPDLKKKKESLISCYRTYKQKIKKCEEEGDIYYVSWAYFKEMDSFLGKIYAPNANPAPVAPAVEDADYDDDIGDNDDSSSSKGPRTFVKRTIPKPPDDDDECSAYGVLIAKKLRRLSEDRRDVMMVKINQLFVDERKEMDYLEQDDNPTSTLLNEIKPSPSPSCNEDLVVLEIKPDIEEHKPEIRTYSHKKKQNVLKV